MQRDVQMLKLSSQLWLGNMAEVCLKWLEVENILSLSQRLYLILIAPSPPPSPVADKPVHLMLTAGFGFRQRPDCKAATPSKGKSWWQHRLQLAIRP